MEKDFENLKEYVLLLEERLSTLEKKQKETKKPTKQAYTKKSIPKQPDIQEFKYMDVYEVYPDKVSVVFYNNTDTARSIIDISKDQVENIIKDLEGNDEGTLIEFSDYSLGPTCCYEEGSWKCY